MEKNFKNKLRNMPIAIVPTMVGAATLSNVYQGLGFTWIKHITIWAAILILLSYLGKIVFHFDAVKSEYSNTVPASLYAGLTMITMIIGSYVFTYNQTIGKGLWFVGLILHAIHICVFTFRNVFKGINKEKFNDSLNGKLLLSYSSIDNYNRCAFRYYLNNILKITEFEETFAQSIGTIFHDVLSKAFKENFDFDLEFENVIKEYDFSNKEEFFMKKLKEELRFIIDTINKQNSFNSLDKSLYENKVYINKESNIKLTFMGIIDKLLYKEENNKTYLVIIDYKTGFPHTNLNNTIYGIDMQLPVYLYLAKEGLFKNAEVIGFYLQKILNNEIVRDPKKTYEQQKEDNLKLLGYTIDEPELASKFDFSYTDSEVVKSLKFGQNGFYAYSKVLSEEKINKLIEIVKDNIDNAFDNILDAKFNINPKRVGKDNIGCSFCKYSDICFMKEEDVVILDEHNNLDFL